MRVLVFDTETTGLPAGRRTSIYETEKWPYMLQLSYIVYDTDTNATLGYVDNIIRVPDELEISEESTRIHGITKETCQARGVDVVGALEDFDDWLRECDLVVGHNLSFDKRMVIVEHIRNGLRSGLGIETQRAEYCTMKHGSDVCKIVVSPPDRKSYYKYPKLGELYMQLFGEEASGAHNAFADILFCLRCYCMMKHEVDPRRQCATLRQLFRTHCCT